MSNKRDDRKPRIRKRSRPNKDRSGVPLGVNGSPVGYGNPPAENIWKKNGKSPNPQGRPKGSKSLKAMIYESGQKPVKIRINGEEIEIPMIYATIYKLWEKAGSKGDIAIFKYLADMYQQKERDNIADFMDRDRYEFFELKLFTACILNCIDPETLGLGNTDLEEASAQLAQYKDSLPSRF